jgi:hypothetical protein
LLDELVSPSCPMTCKIASSASMPIQNQLNSNDLECHKKYPNIMDHSYVGVCVENHTPPTPSVALCVRVCVHECHCVCKPAQCWPLCTDGPRVWGVLKR